MGNQKARLGEICSGSVQPRDVIPPLLRELREVGGESALASALRDTDLGSFVHFESLDWFGDWEAYAESEEASDDVLAILDELTSNLPMPHEKRKNS